MSSKSVKTLPLGDKNLILYFKKKLQDIKKNKWGSITAVIKTNTDDSFTDASFMIDDDNIIYIKAIGDEYKYKIDKKGNFTPLFVNSETSFGGSNNIDVVQYTGNESLRDKCISKIYDRFCNVESKENVLYFFGHVLNELYKWLDSEGHVKESLCLLSFVTKNPIYGAFLYLQMVVPLRDKTKKYYLSTDLLNAWVKSPQADIVFGYSFPEDKYKVCANEIFDIAVNKFKNIESSSDKSIPSLLSSYHRSAISKNESFTKKRYEDLLTIYISTLGDYTGNRVEVYDSNSLLPLHDSIFAYQLKNVIDQLCNDYRPDTIILLAQSCGINSTFKADIFNVGYDDDSKQKDMIECIIKTNLVFPFESIVYNTDLDFFKSKQTKK